MSDWQCEAINRRNQLPGNTRNQLALFYCPRSIPSPPQSYLHIGRLQSRFAIWSRKRCLICQMSNQIHSSATVGWSSVDFKKSSKGVREPVKNYLAENHVSKKPLAEMGGTPTPPLTESPLSFSGNFFPKRTKNDFLY